MRILKSIVFILGVMMVVLWVVSTYIEVVARRLTISTANQVPEIEAVVVPGASVYRSGKLSPVLEKRMLAAIQVLQLRPSARLLVSGHTIPGGYSETRAMAEFARKRGINTARIVEDASGRSTYVTLLHCRREFGLKRVLLVTQAYHLPRALYIGSRLGLDIRGLAATDSGEEQHFPFREYFVRFKDFILLRISKGFNAN